MNRKIEGRNLHRVPGLYQAVHSVTTTAGHVGSAKNVLAEVSVLLGSITHCAKTFQTLMSK